MLHWCVCASAVFRSGQPSTAAAVLEEMTSQHALPGIILQHRKISKIVTGFLDQFVKEALKAAQRQPPGDHVSAQCCDVGGDGGVRLFGTVILDI